MPHSKKTDYSFRSSEQSSKFNMRQSSINSPIHSSPGWNYSQLISALVIASIFVVCVVATVFYRQNFVRLIPFSGGVSGSSGQSQTHRVTVTRADDFLHNNEPSAVYQANSEWIWLGAKQLETSGSGSRKAKPQVASSSAEISSKSPNANPELTVQLLEPLSVSPKASAQCKCKCD